jgi:hypothetical protein
MLDAIYDIALGMLLNDATSKKLGKKKSLVPIKLPKYKRIFKLYTLLSNL